MVAFKAWIAVSLILAGSMAYAEPWTLQSTPQRVALLELFSSEGCRSCPPADQWLSDLKDTPGLWKEVVPVAFHVDYWNYLGWEDMMSSRRYSARQRQYARAWAGDYVYTPCFALNGREWTDWRRQRRLPEQMEEVVGVLRVEALKNHAYRCTFEPTEKRKGLRAHLALLGTNISTQVRAGENEGKTLHHDFVVLGYQAKDMLVEGKAPTAVLFAENRSEVIPGRLAIAVWVTGPDDLIPMQATGGYLGDIPELPRWE